jgi:hypothetical protein
MFGFIHLFHLFSAVAYETRNHIGASPIQGIKLFTLEENVNVVTVRPRRQPWRFRTTQPQRR